METKPEYVFEDYLNSTLLDVHRWSTYPEVLALREQMFEALDYKGTKKEINHVTVVLLNLYYAYCLDPDKWVSYSRDKNSFREGKRYNKLHLKYDIFIATIDKLFKLGYIEDHTGFQDEKTKISFMSRMKATPKFIDLVEVKHAVTFRMIGKYAPDELIELRDVEGEPVEYKDDNADVRVMLPVLQAYNDLLSRTYIDIHFDVADIQQKIDARRRRKDKKTGLPKDYRLVVNLSNKRVRRIFNKSTFKQGGRFYGGWWQGIPSDLRKKIIIDKDYTVEIDYSGLHIYLLYALKGINFADLEKEPYIYPKDNDPDELRPILKVLLLAAVNSKDEATCIKAVQYEINMNRSAFPDKLPDLKTAYQEFKVYHSDIADMFCSQYGLKLQKLDSVIAETVVNAMTTEDIPVLVVHDSFVCSKKEESFLYEVMIAAYHHHASRYGVSDELSKFSTNPIEVKTKDITLDKSENLREEDVLSDYLAWADKPQGRRFTNYLLKEDPATNVAIKVFNECITETGLDLEQPVFLQEDFDMEDVV